MPILSLTVRVRPGASRTRVGGRYGDPAEVGDVLVVAVSAPPVDGAANEAVAKAVAAAFDVRPREVSIVSGHQSRTKVLTLTVDDREAAVVRLHELLDLS